MSKSPVLRPARLEDHAGVVRLFSVRSAVDPATLQAFVLRILERGVGREDVLLLVAELDGEVIGWSRAARFDPADDAPPNAAPAGWYLLGLNVLPPHRRQGLGRRLTEARMAWLRGRAEVVWTFANTDNHASIALHEPFGFEPVTEDFWFPGTFDPGVPMVLLRARLGR